MSVEGLWAIYYSAAGQPLTAGQSGGATVVLETERIFGGDAAFFYLGKYTLVGTKLTAQAHITHYHGDNLTAFGTRAKVFDIELEGEHKDKQVVGRAWLKGHPQPYMQIVMRFLANLP